MSFDYKLLQTCSHRINEELVPVDIDARTLRLNRFVANKQNVRLLLNGKDLLPQGGLGSSARVIAGNLGPFSIQSNVNDLLSFKVNDGSRQTLLLLPGGDVRVQDLVAYLNSQAQGVKFSVSNGYLVMKTIRQGTGAKIYLEPVQDDDTGEDIGTAHATLGFANRFEAVGKEVMPAWQVEAIPGTVPPLQPYQLRFVKPLDSFYSFFEVSYYTAREVCPRCHGLGIEYDWRPDSDGEWKIVENEDLLVQMVEKIILTILGSDPFAPWYGTDLLSLVGTKAVNFIRREIARQITTALSKLQNIQAQQQRIQQVTDREFLARIDQVDVRQATSITPTLYLVSVGFSTRSGATQEVSQAVNFGGPSDLFAVSQSNQSIEAFNEQFGLVRRG